MKWRWQVLPGSDHMTKPRQNQQPTTSSTIFWLATGMLALTKQIIWFGTVLVMTLLVQCGTEIEDADYVF